MFADGNAIDDLARELFPGGLEVDGYNVDGFLNTQRAIQNNPDNKVLYQPTTVADDLSARGDILVKSKTTKGSWDIHEVKSATKVKPEYYDDLAFQKICFEQAGIAIDKTFIHFVNNQYVREGAIDARQLMTSENLTDEVNKLIPQTKQTINKAREVYEWGKTLSVDNIMTCEEGSNCEWANLWIDSLPEKEQQSLREQLPTMDADSFGKKKIDKVAIQTILNTFQYPLYFLDYETYNTAIPPFDGTWPYQQIPFQYSVYVVETPGATPQTFDFLATEFSNPMKPLAESLRDAIGPTGTVFAWYASFEMGRNTEMADAYPEYVDFMQSINDRTYDLMQVFKQGHYVDPAFGGSNSLKAVMPVLVPELSYKHLNIQEGGTASASWPKLTELPDGEARDQLYRDMIDYCRLDVYGMVKIVEVLQDTI
jgi:hypothetical protein